MNTRVVICVKRPASMRICEKRPTKETYDYEKRPTKGTYNYEKSPVEETYICNKKRPTQEACREKLQKDLYL